MQYKDQSELNFDDDKDDFAGNDYHLDRTYESVDFKDCAIQSHTFEGCTFKACRFNEMSLARVVLETCTFVNCEFILTTIENATLNTVYFKESKLMGLNFADCNKFCFLPEFEDCILDSVVFYSNNLQKGKFIHCRIKNCDFTECDMREVNFDESTFETTVFQKCNLAKADFRKACNYSVDPFNNNIKKARFSLPEAQSFLRFLGIDLQ